jgi:hypothetical protein
MGAGAANPWSAVDVSHTFGTVDPSAVTHNPVDSALGGTGAMTGGVHADPHTAGVDPHIAPAGGEHAAGDLGGLLH